MDIKIERKMLCTICTLVVFILSFCFFFFFEYFHLAMKIRWLIYFYRTFNERNMSVFLLQKNE